LGIASAVLRDLLETIHRDRGECFFRFGARGGGRSGVMAIDTGEAAIRTIIAEALIEHGEDSGRPMDALFAMRQAEAVVKALEHAGYQIRRRGA
jgi:hypothetical protein